MIKWSKAPIWNLPCVWSRTQYRDYVRTAQYWFWVQCRSNDFRRHHPKQSVPLFHPRGKFSTTFSRAGTLSGKCINDTLDVACPPTATRVYCHRRYLMLACQEQTICIKKAGWNRHHLLRRIRRIGATVESFSTGWFITTSTCTEKRNRKCIMSLLAYSGSPSGPVVDAEAADATTTMLKVFLPLFFLSLSWLCVWYECCRWFFLISALRNSTRVSFYHFHRFLILISFTTALFLFTFWSAGHILGRVHRPERNWTTGVDDGFFNFKASNLALRKRKQSDDEEESVFSEAFQRQPPTAHSRPAGWWWWTNTWHYITCVILFIISGSLKIWNAFRDIQLYTPFSSTCFHSCLAVQHKTRPSHLELNATLVCVPRTTFYRVKSLSDSFFYDGVEQLYSSELYGQLVDILFMYQPCREKPFFPVIADHNSIWNSTCFEAFQHPKRPSTSLPLFWKKMMVCHRVRFIVPRHAKTGFPPAGPSTVGIEGNFRRRRPCTSWLNDPPGHELVSSGQTHISASASSSLMFSFFI